MNPGVVKELHPGDEVHLPDSAAEPKAESAVTAHRVQKGDTLASIAQKYDVDPGDLKAWNRMKGNRLRVGQLLRLTPR
jgi:membrane-bound lytic murein transglycosylase D